MFKFQSANEGWIPRVFRVGISDIPPATWTQNYIYPSPEIRQLEYLNKDTLGDIRNGQEYSPTLVYHALPNQRVFYWNLRKYYLLSLTQIAAALIPFPKDILAQKKSCFLC